MIRQDPIAAFYDAIRAMNYAQTIEVGMEVAAFADCAGTTGQEIAQALSDAAEGKPTNERLTRATVTTHPTKQEAKDG